jgi:putative transposase
MGNLMEFAKAFLMESLHASLSITTQCDLIQQSRSFYYAHQNCLKEKEIALIVKVPDSKFMGMIDRISTELPFCGSRKIIREMKIRYGIVINRKHIQCRLNILNITSIAPWKRTSIPDSCHKKFPFLLRNVRIERLNQVWSTDFTYIQAQNGYYYLVAVIDWYSRKVLSWRMSCTLDTSFCVDALENALFKFG